MKEITMCPNIPASFSLSITINTDTNSGDKAAAAASISEAMHCNGFTDIKTSGLSRADEEVAVSGTLNAPGITAAEVYDKLSEVYCVSAHLAARLRSEPDTRLDAPLGSEISFVYTGLGEEQERQNAAGVTQEAPKTTQPTPSILVTLAALGCVVAHDSAEDFREKVLFIDKVQRLSPRDSAALNVLFEQGPLPLAAVDIAAVDNLICQGLVVFVAHKGAVGHYACNRAGIDAYKVLQA